MNHEQIVKMVSVREDLPLALTDFIIKDSLKNAIRELANTDLGEVEIAGFGRLSLSETKLKKRLDKYYDLKQVYEQRIVNHESGIEIMEPEIYKNISKRLRNIGNDIVNLQRKYSRLKAN